MKHRRSMAAVLAAVALLAAGCGGSSQAKSGGSSSAGMKDGVVVRTQGEARDHYIQRLYEAAQKEGTAVLYTPSQQAEVEALQEGWNKLFPKVTLQVTSGSTDEILQRALVEGRSGHGKTDGYQGSMAELTALKAKDLLAMYRPVNEQDSDPDLVDPKQPWTTDFYLTFHVAYNTDKVKDPSSLPTTFAGFADPKWKGQIAIDLQPTEWVAGLIQSMGLNKATDLLTQLKKNGVRLIEGSSTRTEQLASGQFSVMLDGYGHAIEKYIEKGAPIAAADPQPEPLTQVLGLMAVMKGAPHPNAARLIEEFALSPEGQQAYADQHKAGSAAKSDPYPKLFGGATPEPLGPDVDYDQARQVIKEILVGA